MSEMDGHTIETLLFTTAFTLTSLTSSFLVSIVILSKHARANFAMATAWSGLAFGIPQTAT